MGEPIKYYLPNEIFILLATLGYGLCVRILGAIKGNECVGVSGVGAHGEGLVLWFFLLAMFGVVFLSKYLDSHHLGISFIGGVIAFTLGLGLHANPLDCVIPADVAAPASFDGVNWVRVMQAVFVGVPTVLYALVLFTRSG